MKLIILLAAVVLATTGCVGNTELKTSTLGANIELKKEQARVNQTPLASVSLPLPAGMVDQATIAREQEFMTMLAVIINDQAISPEQRLRAMEMMERVSDRIAAAGALQVTVGRPDVDVGQIGMPTDEWAGVIRDGLKTVGTLGGIYLGGEAAIGLAGTVGGAVVGGVTGALDKIPAPADPVLIPTQVIEQPVVTEIPTQVIEQPVIHETPTQVIEQPVIHETPTQVIEQPVIHETPTQVIEQPVIVE